MGDQTQYSSGWESKVQECFKSRVTLPQLGNPVPSDIAMDVFLKMWGSWSHWRLCSYQSVTVPLKTVEFTITSANGSSSNITVQVLRLHPLVVAIPALASPDECNVLSKQAGDDLTRATVGGVGKTSTSRARRTLTRNLYPDLDDETSTLTRMANRFFEVARQATGYELYPEGQEPINWLYYKPGYEYRPHCDGRCGAKLIKKGSRVASSLLYCNVATDGGGTVFPPDKLKLEPTAGMFMLFAYNPDPRSLTSHAACPVLKGSKSTATQWYREGVSDEKPWDQFENWGSFTKPRKSCPSFESQQDCPPRCEWTGSACDRKGLLAAIHKHPEL